MANCGIVFCSGTGIVFVLLPRDFFDIGNTLFEVTLLFLENASGTSSDEDDNGASKCVSSLSLGNSSGTSLGTSIYGDDSSKGVSLSEESERPS